MDNKFKSEQFLKDIGLDFHMTMLGIPLKDDQLPANMPPTPKNNIITMVPESNRMDSPYQAIYIHLQNLINTYGRDSVMFVVDSITKDE